MLHWDVPVSSRPIAVDEYVGILPNPLESRGHDTTGVARRPVHGNGFVCWDTCRHQEGSKISEFSTFDQHSHPRGRLTSPWTWSPASPDRLQPWKAVVRLTSAAQPRDLRLVPPVPAWQCSVLLARIVYRRCIYHKRCAPHCAVPSATARPVP
jgi:hypothetical protein